MAWGSLEWSRGEETRGGGRGEMIQGDGRAGGTERGKEGRMKEVTQRDRPKRGRG